MTACMYVDCGLWTSQNNPKRQNHENIGFFGGRYRLSDYLERRAHNFSTRTNFKCSHTLFSYNLI
jgi:hypothetical protein